MVCEANLTSLSKYPLISNLSDSVILRYVFIVVVIYIKKKVKIYKAESMTAVFLLKLFSIS